MFINCEFAPFFLGLNQGSFFLSPPLVLEGVDIKESGRASRVVEEDP